LEIDYSAYLPEPTPLRQSAVVEFAWGAQHFRWLCVAADVRIESWQPGETIEWLHFKGVQIFNAIPGEPESKIATKYLVPAIYVTRFDDGPEYRITQVNMSTDIVVFPPEHSAPANSLGVEVIRRRISERLIEEG
jgi:hypothetical protein